MYNCTYTVDTCDNFNDISVATPNSRNLCITTILNSTTQTYPTN